MQIAAGSSILDAAAAGSNQARPQPRDAAPAATRQETWTAPAAVGRGRLIDLLV
jgi:hypothetical protein